MSSPLRITCQYRVVFQYLPMLFYKGCILLQDGADTLTAPGKDVEAVIFVSYIEVSQQIGCTEAVACAKPPPFLIIFCHIEIVDPLLPVNCIHLFRFPNQKRSVKTRNTRLV